MFGIKRILCAVDFSPFSDRALAYAMKMAVWSGAKLEVLHVVPLMPPSTVSPLSAASRELSARNLASAVERTRLPQVDVTTKLMESAEPAARILEAADTFDADVIVTGSHGRAGVGRVFLGSVVETLLHRCPGPILVIPEPCGGGRRRRRAQAFAHRLCRRFLAVLTGGRRLRAVTRRRHQGPADPPARGRGAGRVPPAPADVGLQLQCRTDTCGSRSGVIGALRALIPKSAHDYCTVDTAVLEGGASRQLLRMAAARQADLVVLGVHGRNPFDLAFFGSNSKDVIRQAHCPVLVVPASRRDAVTSAAS